MKNSFIAGLSFLAISFTVFSEPVSSQARQAPPRQVQQQQYQQNQQQQQQIQQLQGNGWRNINFLDRVNAQNIKPLQCNYRLLQIVKISDIDNDFYFHEFDGVSHNRQKGFSLKKNITLESASSLFNTEKDQNSLGMILSLRRDGSILSCDMLLDFSSEDKLVINCSGVGREEIVEGPGGLPVTLPGGMFASISRLNTDNYMLQEKC